MPRTPIHFPIPGIVIALLVGAVLAPATAQVDRARQFETRYYRVWTDVDYDLARDLCQRMDAMYDEYARRFAAFPRVQPEREKLQVRIFAQRDAFLRYTRDRMPNSGGIFMPGRNLLAAYLEQQGRDDLRRTLQHEAFHQFAYAVIGPDIPIWLNEGLAQVFEEGIWTGRSFMIGQVPPRRIRQLQEDMRQRRLIDFRRLLAMSDEDWARGMDDRATASVQYNQAWAMAHFLIFATGSDGQPLYRGRVIEMLKRSRGGATPRDAFVGAFSDNITGFQERFVEYARTLQPTLEASFIENQSVLADLLVVLKDRGRSFDSVEAFRAELLSRKYRLRYSRGSLEWSSAEDVNVYFTGPQGHPMSDGQLFFQPRHGAPLPDLVCRALDGLQLRTRFHPGADRIEHEVLVEPRR